MSPSAFIGETQVALSKYRRRSGSQARAVLLGSRAWMVGARYASEIGRYFVVDNEPDVLEKVFGVEVFSSQEVPPDAIIPLGDPLFDATYARLT